MKKIPLRLLAALLFFSGLRASAAELGAYDELELLAPEAAATTAKDGGFYTLALPAAPAATGQAVEYTGAHARRLAAMASAGLTQVNFVNGGMNGQDQYYYWGVPRVVKQAKPAQVGIMRHWTSNAQAGGIPVVELIVKSGLLKAGGRPYIIPESHRADYYPDLHGVFFTTPDFAPGLLWMGLLPDSDYVDFTVNPAMGALYLAPGNYLFPCPLNMQKWILDEYLKWKRTGVLPAGMELTFKHIDREGGPQGAIDVPITVVQYQKNGKVTVLRPDLLKKPY